jgi:hypothetical protein
MQKIGGRKMFLALLSMACLLFAPFYMEVEMYKVFSANLLILMGLAIGGNLGAKLANKNKTP